MALLDEITLDPVLFCFWQTDEPRDLLVGPTQFAVPLPEIPIPVLRVVFEKNKVPTDTQIGDSIYDYLRRFPDCPHNLAYAGLLREAFPHIIADMSSQIILIDSKSVDSHYVRRKLTMMRILALLQPDNHSILLQIGLGYFNLSMLYQELRHVRTHLILAIRFLDQLLLHKPADPAALNIRAQIDFLMGDYPKSAERWKAVVAAIGASPASEQLQERIDRIAREDVPDHSLLDDLETVADAVEVMAEGDFTAACHILEQIEAEGSLMGEIPNPDFYVLLGQCREQSGDPGGAFASYQEALEIDDEHPGAREYLERLQDANMNKGGR